MWPTVVCGGKVDGEFPEHGGLLDGQVPVRVGEQGEGPFLAGVSCARVRLLSARFSQRAQHSRRHP